MPTQLHRVVPVLPRSGCVEAVAGSEPRRSPARLALIVVGVSLAVSVVGAIVGRDMALAARKPQAPATSTTSTTAAPTTSTTTAPSPAGLTAAAVDAWSARLTWGTPPSGTASIVILRGTRLIDRLSGASATGYTDRLLWKATTYGYTVRFERSDAAVIAQRTASVTTPAATGSVPRFYADTSFWNQPIAPGSAVDAGSSAMVQKGLVAYASSANFAKSDTWGVPLAYADPASTSYSVGCTMWDCNQAVSSRIPAYAAPTAAGTDQHLAVVDPASGKEVDMWKAAHDTSVDTWSAGTRYGTDPSGWGAMCGLGQRCNGANAAGFAMMGGVIRPEEIAQGRIDHALVFTTPFTRSGVIACPATHTDGKYADPAAIPEGARIQLDPTINVDAQAWPGWKKVVAKALQQYGAYLGDTSGSVAIRGEANINRGYDAWAMAGVSSTSLADLPWSSFRVLAYSTC